MDNAIKKIGKVVIDYTHYEGKDLYSDGGIEDVLLEACKKGKESELLYNSSDYAVLYHLSPIRHNLLEWVSLGKQKSVLEIGSGCGAVTGILAENAGTVTCVELSEKRTLINAYRNKNYDNINIKLGNFQDIEPELGKYDIITLIGVWEYSELYIDSKTPFDDMLCLVKKHLTENGRLIIAIENKMGMKYWNGAQEDHTGKQYSGLNDYTDDRGRKVRTFSKTEIERMLNKNGFGEYRFYYPLPDYKLPDCIYSDKHLPQVGEIRLFGKEYAFTRIYNFNDAIVSDQVCEDGMFEYFANSFLIICGEDYDKIKYVKYNRERRSEYRIKTTIKENFAGNREVIKQGIDSYADEHIHKISTNSSNWSFQYSKIECAEVELKNNILGVKYIDGIEIDKLMYKFKNNPQDFVEELKKIIKQYFYVDEQYLIDGEKTEEFVKVFGEMELGKFKSLRYTNIDLIASNLKIMDDGIAIAYDAEWVFDFPIPYRFVAWRMCKVLYDQYRAYLKSDFAKDKFLTEMGFSAQENIMFNRMEDAFSDYVTGHARREVYTKKYRKTAIMQNTIFY